MSENLKKI